MISRFIYALHYLQYMLFARHKKGHGIHSPFVFHLIQKVFRNKEIDTELERAINIHKKYKDSKEIIDFNDLGAGSAYSRSKSLPLGKIIKRSGVPEKYGKLLFNLVKHFRPKTMLELGTSVGISALYLGSGEKSSKLITIESSQEKLKKASEIISSAKLTNIHFIQSDFDAILDKTLSSITTLDMVFFDGNHRHESTLNYFNQCLNKATNNSVFIFDDIHWSKEMEKAWDEIKRNPKVRVSIDIFRMGIIFFYEELSYQHYVIKF